jgi:molecular chaperone GrpE
MEEKDRCPCIEDEALENQNATQDAKEEKKKKQSKLDKLNEEIEALRAEIKEKDDKYLRMAAEYDNFRRRSREEKQACYDGAMADTLTQILPIIDNIERAALYDDEGKVKEGLVMIAKEIENVLNALGVEEVGHVGEKFDPNLHNAVLHIEDETYGENEIAEVFQKGYKKGNKVIRFAMVKTAN